MEGKEQTIVLQIEKGHRVWCDETIVLYRAWRREPRGNRERRKELTCVRETSKKTPGEEKVWNERDDHVIQRCLTSSGRLCSRNCVACCSVHWPATSCSMMLHFPDPGSVSVHMIVKEHFLRQSVSEWSIALSLFKR